MKKIGIYYCCFLEKNSDEKVNVEEHMNELLTLHPEISENYPDLFSKFTK